MSLKSVNGDRDHMEPDEIADELRDFAEELQEAEDKAEVLQILENVQLMINNEVQQRKPE